MGVWGRQPRPAATTCGTLASACDGLADRIDTAHHDLALAPGHARYTPPKPHEVCSYAYADLSFDPVGKVSWENRSSRRFGDPAREEQVLGELSALRSLGADRYLVAGEFGEITITAAAPTLTWTTDDDGPVAG